MPAKSARPGGVGPTGAGAEGAGTRRQKPGEKSRSKTGSVLSSKRELLSRSTTEDRLSVVAASKSQARSNSASGTGSNATSAPGEVADRLHSAAIHLLRRLRREDDASGLPAPQLSALSVIVFGGPITLGALAAAEQVRPPTITKLVVALETAGLVAREADTDDGRVTRVRATARGTRLLQDGRQRRVASLEASVLGLSRDEREQLASAIPILERIVRGS